ncbi:MAG: alanine--tRNA ligase-related protein [Candidatus Cloacimonetes bacterium]|nr:alanine--tRNA ligase-related protein [Candidatus Cloacimonadota bacterium]
MKFKANDVREDFLNFFKKNGHMEIENLSLIPQNDPTLLIINSGMAPLKDYFTGESIPPSKRMCNIQKCVRTIDINSVGDPHHLTFFEMLGNWSIGDYSKKEAIEFGWRLIKDVFQIDTSKIIVTVFGGDKSLPGISADMESFEIWLNYLPKDRIILLDADSNFWGPTSDTGPCGPCTEIIFDRGIKNGCGKVDCGPECECGRFLEIWNVGVFMQYFMHEDGSLTKLPMNCVDAGAGLERFAMILQGVESVYETDLFIPLIEVLTNKIDINKNKREIRIIADHVRASVFMLADGIIPGKTKREYVLRRIMRRALLYLTILEVDCQLFWDVSQVVIREYSCRYPELKDGEDFIKNVIFSEITSFNKVLSKGLRELDRIIKSSTSAVISGDDAFKLQDTLGFPIDLICEIAGNKGMTVDKERFNFLLEEQRQRSRK